MATTEDTKVSNLVVNVLTKAEYDAAEKSETEFYLTTDEIPSTVSVTQTLTSGTEIGSVTVDGTAVTLYAPTPKTVSVSQTVASGTEIGGITVGGTTTKLYAPSLATETLEIMLADGTTKTVTVYVKES